MVSMASSEAPDKKGFLKNGGVVSNGGGRVSLDSSRPRFFKRRSVFAIRDFPPGCGPRTTPAPKVVESQTLKQSECLVETLSPHLLIPHSTHQSHDDLGSAKLQDPTKNLDLGTEKMEELAPVEAEPMKNSESAAGHLTAETQLKVSDNSQSPVVDSVVMSKPKKFPPRRSLSAARDFPPGCGRNVPSVTIKDLRKPDESSMSSGKHIRDGKGDQIVKTSARDMVTIKDLQKPVDSSNERSMSSGKPIRDGKMDQVVKTGAKDKDDRIQTGDTISRKMNEKKEIRGAEVKSVHGKESGKNVLRQEQTGNSSIQLSREKGVSQADSSSNKKVGIGGGSSGGKSGMESVKLSKDMNYKKKFPVNQDVGLDPSNNQAVVVALMSKKNCIWGQANKTPRPSNANQPRLEQVKKTVKSANDVQAAVEEGVKTFNSDSDNLTQVGEGIRQQVFADREIVLSLMAAAKCPWKYGKKTSKSSSGKAKQRSSKNL